VAELRAADAVSLGRVTVRAAWIVVRHSIFSAGYRGPKAGALLGRLAAATCLLSIGTTIFVSYTVAGPGPGAATIAIIQPMTLIAVTLAALGIIVLLSAGIDADRCLRAFLPLPFSGVWIAAVVSVPPVGMVFLASLVLLPPMVLVLHRMSGVGTADLIALLLPVLGQGLCVGVTLTAVAGLVALRSRLGRSSVYPLAICLWGALSAVSFYGWHGGHGFFRSAAADISGVVSLWPVVGRALGNGHLNMMILLVLWLTVGAVTGAGLSCYYLSLAKGLDMPSHGNVLYAWHAGRFIPVVCLQVVRLLRRPRVFGSLAASALVLLICWWAAKAQDPAARAGFAQFGYILCGSVLSHIPLIARGTNSDIPAEILLFREPRRWAWSVTIAALLIVAFPATGFVGAMYVLVPGLSNLLFGCGIIGFGIASGALLSALLRPGDGGGPETLGLLLIGFASYVAVMILGQAFNGEGVVGLVAAAMALIMLGLGPEIENRRYLALFR
jgi:hypothetical protein